MTSGPSGGAVRLALAGYGAWGANLARAVAATPGADLAAIADPDPGRAAAALKRHPDARSFPSLDAALEDRSIAAVVVATPARTHAAIARRALESGRDAFVEKPLTTEPATAADLCRVASESGRVLMVGHLLRFHPAVRRLFEGARRGDLGRLLYLRTERANPGRARADVGVLHALLPHDVSLALHLLGNDVVSVRAAASDFRGTGRCDWAQMSLEFRGGARATLLASWLEAAKVRRATLVGERGTAVFDDTEPREKLRVVGGPRRGEDVVEPSYGSYGEWMGLRFGEIHVPEIEPTEPLLLEMAHFVACVRDRETPATPGEDGLRVVRLLSAAERSLETGGAPVSPFADGDRSP